MSATDVAWAIGRIYIGWPVRLFTRARAVGLENVPTTGGAVYAINHLHWIDIPLVGLLSPRTVWFVAKAEAANYPVVGGFLRLHGAIAIQRGASDREAVRRMRDESRAGHVIFPPFSELELLLSSLPFLSFSLFRSTSLSPSASSAE